MNDYACYFITPESLMKVFGERLRTAMSEQEMSPNELAKKTRISSSTIENWITGKAKTLPSTAYLARLSCALNFTCDWLLGLED